MGQCIIYENICMFAVDDNKAESAFRDVIPNDYAL